MRSDDYNPGRTNTRISDWLSGKNDIFLYALPSLGCVFMVWFALHYGIDTWIFERMEAISLFEQILFYDDYTRIWNHMMGATHRVIFPFLFALARARLIGLPVEHSLILGPVITLGILWILCRILTITHHRYTFAERIVLTVLLCFFGFSLTQWETWTRAFTGMNMASFFAVAAIAILYGGRSALRITAAALLCSLATFTFSNGIVAWASCLPLFVLRKQERWILHKKAVILWVLCASVTAWAFFWGRTERYTNLAVDSAETQLQFFRYVVVLIGAPLSPNHSMGAAIAGMCVLLVFFLSSAWFFFKKKSLYAQMSPWFCVALFSLLSACTIAIGRAYFGPEQAMSSRYITATFLFVVALICMTHLLFQRKTIRVVLSFVWLALVAVNIVQGSAALPRIESDKVYFDQGKACLEAYTVASSECLGRLSWKGTNVRTQASTFERLDFLQPFHIDETMEFMQGTSDTYGQFYDLSQREIRGALLPVASGWVALKNCKPPARIVLTYGEHRSLLGLTVASLPRMPFAGCESQAEWQVTINTDVLQNRVRDQRIDAWAYDKHTGKLFKLREHSNI